MGRNIVTVESELKEIKLDLEQLKRTQFIGQYNLQIYELQSTASYDVSFSKTSSGIPTQIDLIFTVDHQPYPFFQTPSILYQDLVNPLTQINSPVAFRAEGTILFGEPYTVRVPHLIYNTTGSTHTYYLKFIMKCSDTFTSASFETVVP